MTDQPVIRFRNVHRNFGGTQALRDVDLEIPAGSVVGLLGPNGGGKTTLLRHIPGLILPAAGQVEVFGTPAGQLEAGQLARIGYVSQETHLMDWLTVGETVRFVAAGLPTWDPALTDRLIKEFELDPDKRVSTLSLGTKQRLSILLAVCHGPDLLLLDEPASSLDPVAREDFLHLLMEMVQEANRTIIISSHILSDVEKVIDHVLIIDAGRVHCDTPLDELRENYHRVSIRAIGPDLPDNLPVPGMVTATGDKRSKVVVTSGVDRVAISTALSTQPFEVEIRNLNFEEIYRLIVTREGVPA